MCSERDGECHLHQDQVHGNHIHFKIVLRKVSVYNSSDDYHSNDVDYCNVKDLTCEDVDIHVRIH